MASMRPVLAEDAESDAAYWLGLESAGRFAYVHGFFAGRVGHARVPDAGLHAADGVRGLREGAAV
jgi:hypothetical protein